MFMEPGHNSQITLRRDEVDTIDDIVNPYAEPTVYDLIAYSEKQLPVDLLHTEPSFMKVNIVVSPDHTYITRTQYTFLAWIGDLGALLDSLQ